MYIDNPNNLGKQKEKNNNNLGAKVYLYSPQPKQKQKTGAIKNVYTRQPGQPGKRTR